MNTVRRLLMSLAPVLLGVMLLAGAVLSATAVFATDAVPVEIPVPPPGKGVIVFFRPSQALMFSPCSVRENEVLISGLGSGKYFFHIAEPGPHIYTAASETKDILNFEVEDGETYFVKCGIVTGFFVDRPNLMPSNREAFMAAVPKLKMEVPKFEATKPQ